MLGTDNITIIKQITAPDLNATVDDNTDWILQRCLLGLSIKLQW